MVFFGSVVEWSMALVLKTSDSQGSVSSNLTASAKNWRVGWMVRHRIANPTLRKGRVGSTPTLSAKFVQMAERSKATVCKTVKPWVQIPLCTPVCCFLTTMYRKVLTKCVVVLYSMHELRKSSNFSTRFIKK